MSDSRYTYGRVSQAYSAKAARLAVLARFAGKLRDDLHIREATRELAARWRRRLGVLQSLTDDPAAKTTIRQMLGCVPTWVEVSPPGYFFCRQVFCPFCCGRAASALYKELAAVFPAVSVDPLRSRVRRNPRGIMMETPDNPCLLLRQHFLRFPYKQPATQQLQQLYSGYNKLRRGDVQRVPAAGAVTRAEFTPSKAGWVGRIREVYYITESTSVPKLPGRVRHFRRPSRRALVKAAATVFAYDTVLLTCPVPVLQMWWAGRKRRRAVARYGIFRGG